MTTTREPVRITAHDNPLLVKLRRLKRDGSAYRRVGAVWLEGDHLCRALLARGGKPAQALVGMSAWQAQPALRALAAQAARVAIVADELCAGISTLESPAPIGFVLEPVPAPTAATGVATVVLDRLQDAGNAGSILRSAAAFGIVQVVALKGSVGLWSPKVLRAGMGAHFALRIVEGASAGQLDALGVPLVATSSHDGVALPRAALPQPCAWLFGHEGQGLEASLAARAVQRVCIPLPGGEESLNVAAAAAVCLYETARRAADDAAASQHAGNRTPAAGTPATVSGHRGVLK